MRRNSWRAIGVKLKYRKKKIPRSWTQKTREKMCRKFGKSWSAKKRKDVYIFSRTCNNWWPNGQCFVWNLCLTALRYGVCPITINGLNQSIRIVLTPRPGHEIGGFSPKTKKLKNWNMFIFSLPNPSHTIYGINQSIRSVLSPRPGAWKKTKATGKLVLWHLSDFLVKVHIRNLRSIPDFCKTVYRGHPWPRPLPG